MSSDTSAITLSSDSYTIMIRSFIGLVEAVFGRIIHLSSGVSLHYQTFYVVTSFFSWHLKAFLKIRKGK